MASSLSSPDHRLPIFLSLLGLFFITCPTLIPFAKANNEHGHQDFSMTATTLKFPEGQAERLIRQLNLFPKHEINICPGRPTALSESRIVERRFHLHVLGNSGATVEELGHHAGYYRLPHSKDARYDNYTMIVDPAVSVHNIL